MEFFKIARFTIPVLIGYVPLGMAFGLLAAKMGIAWYYAFLMSIFIYAGAGQFLAVTLFAAMSSFAEIFISILFLNLRHFFYGLSMIEDFKILKGWAKKYAIFGLTDETFALLKTLKIPKEQKAKAFVIITLLNQMYWIIGSLIGALLGENIEFDSKGIEFCLTALFVVLGIELYKQNKAQKPLIISMAIGVFGIICLPSSNMLVLSLLLCVASLMIFRKWIDNE